MGHHTEGLGYISLERLSLTYNCMARLNICPVNSQREIRDWGEEDYRKNEGRSKGTQRGSLNQADLREA